MGIGQKIDLMLPHLDVICPMIYPSHYARGEYGIAHPNASPVPHGSLALRDTVERVKGTDTKIRPWLQDFSLGVRYGAPEVRAQIKAARERGVTEYLLWNAANRYTVAALVPPKPKPLAKIGKKDTARGKADDQANVTPDATTVPSGTSKEVSKQEEAKKASPAATPALPPPRRCSNR
jgi:hypothetical protein